MIHQETLDELRDGIEKTLASRTGQDWNVGITYDEMGSYLIRCNCGNFRFQHTVPIRKMAEYQELKSMNIGDALTTVALKHFLDKE